MDRSYEGWFYASGTIALTFSFSFFIGLLSFMLYRIPTIQAALNDSDETPIELFEMPTALNQSMFVGNDRQAAETTPSMSAARSISDLFGETNTTSIQTLLNDEKRQNTAKLNLPSVKIDAINALKGADSRTDPKIQLNTFKAINSAQEGSSRASRAAKTLEESYYSEVYKRLYAAWTPGHSDLGKMAQIEMRIERSGAVSYRIKSVTGDQPFIDRLNGALEEIRVSGLAPPPRLITLDVRFIVKE